MHYLCITQGVAENLSFPDTGCDYCFSPNVENIRFSGEEIDEFVRVNKKLS